jgi:hypothetical protein
MSITLVNGSILHLLGADNVNRLVGVNPSFIVFNEFSLEDPKLAELYRPIAAENNATMIYAGTPRGMDHLQKIFQYAQSDPERWYSSLLTIDDTRRDADGEDGGPVIDQEAVDQDRAEGADEDLLRQEYMCSFNGVTVGSFYGKQVQTMREEARITDVPWNPRLPVCTAWDLGISDAMTVIFWQNDGDWINMIDAVEETGASLTSFIAMVRNRAYKYSNHYAPHDIKQRELTSGKSRIEIARSLGIDFRIVENLSIQDGIQALRSLFGRMRIDRTKGGRLVECLAM